MPKKTSYTLGGAKSAEREAERGRQDDDARFRRRVAAERHAMDRDRFEADARGMRGESRRNFDLEQRDRELALRGAEMRHENRMEDSRRQGQQNIRNARARTQRSKQRSAGRRR